MGERLKRGGPRAGMLVARDNSANLFQALPLSEVSMTRQSSGSARRLRQPLHTLRAGGGDVLADRVCPQRPQHQARTHAAKRRN